MVRHLSKSILLSLDDKEKEGEKDVEKGDEKDDKKYYEKKLRIKVFRNQQRCVFGLRRGGKL